MNKTNLPVLEKYLERSFMLATFQIWNEGEKLMKKVWTPRQNPHEPYIVGAWNGTSLTAYYDFAGIRWMKQELKRREDEDKNFFDWLITESRTSYDTLRPILEAKKPLSLTEFPKFFKDAA